MEEFKHIIKDPLGMHARPAGQLVKFLSDFESSVTVTTPNGAADARRLMALMRMGAKQGTHLHIRIEGADEQALAQKLQDFLKNNL